MRVAAVQQICTETRDDNLSRAAAHMDKAVAAGAALVVLPELFASLGSGRSMRAAAESVDGPTVTWACELAARHGIWLVAGSFVEQADGQLFNTSPLVGPNGQLVATYRKIHLFDVAVDGAGAHESEVFAAGRQLVVAPTDGVPIGLTTCYDLRFPELFRILTLQGAGIVALPSAFTAATGPPHWEPLVRARAIENQVFVIAPDQCGTSPDGIARHGHSLIVDPWGRILGDGGTSDGVVVVDLDLAEIERARHAVPSLANRRPETYDWPG
jgi:deaminated glutathione amidase